MRNKPSTCELIRFVDKRLENRDVYPAVVEMLRNGSRFLGFSDTEFFWVLEWFKRTRLENNPQRIDEELYVQAVLRQVGIAVSELSVEPEYYDKAEGREEPEPATEALLDQT